MWIRWTANAVSSRGLVKEERFLKASGRSEARVNEETKEREPSRATRGTIGPPYASALEGWVAGTTTSRCTTSPSRATWSSRKDKACSECGASSTGAKNTREGNAPPSLGSSLGGAERGWVVAVAGSESVATACGSTRSPVASGGVSLAPRWEEGADPAIARVFSLRTFVANEEDSRKSERRFSFSFSSLFRVRRSSLPKRARSHHLPPRKPPCLTPPPPLRPPRYVSSV